jgi:type II secretion system protein C
MDQKRFVKFLWIAKAALIAVLLYMGFGVVTDRLHWATVFNPGTASGEQHATDPQAARPEPHSPSDYSAIVDRNLFTDGGIADTPRANVNSARQLESMGSAEELGLRLVGAIAGGPVASRAIIQSAKTNATGSYRIGDTVASATIEDIQRDVVVMRYRNQSLVLKLRAGKSDDAGQKPQEAAQKAQEAGKTDGQNQPSAAAEAASAAPSRGGYMTELFHKATIEPYVKNGQTEGLQITGLENIPMAELLGLRNGDVVQSVNGQQLTSKQKAFQVLMKAKTQPKVNIQLLRDGNNKNLSFDF